MIENNQMIEIEKFKNGLKKLELRIDNFEQLLEHSTGEIGPDIKKKGVKIRYYIDKGSQKIENELKKTSNESDQEALKKVQAKLKFISKSFSELQSNYDIYKITKIPSRSASIYTSTIIDYKKNVIDS